MAELVALNVVFQIRDDPGGIPGRTAIDKRPTAAATYIAERGVQGDAQLDTRHHGRSWQAVYAYADEDLDWWRGHLQRDLTPGTFGENLTTRGLDVTRSILGEQWRIGSGEESVVVEVTSPRIPCQTFTNWLGEAHWVRRFTEHGAPGAYLRVLQPGTVRAGDPIEIVARPDHGVRLADVFPAVRPEVAQALLAAYRSGQLHHNEDLFEDAVRASSRVPAGH